MNYDIQEFEHKYKRMLGYIQKGLNAYQEIVCGLRDIGNKIYADQTINHIFYLKDYDWSKEIGDLVDEACDKFVVDSKYLSYEQLLSFVEEAIGDVKALANEDFVNKTELLNEVNKNLSNFYTLLEVFNDMDNLTYLGLAKLEDTKLSFLVGCNTDEIIDVFLPDDDLFYEKLNSYETMQEFAYANPLINNIDFLSTIVCDTNPENFHDVMKEKLIESIEKYGIDKPDDYEKFILGYFSHDKEIRTIYHSALDLASKMQDEFDFKERTSHTRRQR